LARKLVKKDSERKKTKKQKTYKLPKEGREEGRKKRASVVSVKPFLKVFVWLGRG